MIGSLFGRLRVIGVSRPDSRISCLCSCGGEVLVSPGDLVTGNTKSCGCFKLDEARQRLRTHGCLPKDVFKIWMHMKDRCLNPNNSDWSNYGGRGVTICPSWMSFAQFRDDMGPRPSREYSIDRIDNTQGYHKGNCRWATKKQQNRNRRSSRLETLNGVTKTLADWADHFGIAYGTMHSRMQRWGCLKKAISRPIRGQKKIDNLSRLNDNDLSPINIQD